MDCVMLDIGGTFVKHSMVKKGEFTQPGMFPIAENGTVKQIIRPIVKYLQTNSVGKIAISMPGPADYRAGTVLMKHKFAALYGVNLRELLNRELSERDIVFVHDGVAFMLGEAIYGAAKGCSYAAGVMLGTGLGFVLFRNGKVLVHSKLTPLMPLWSTPYGSSIAENYVSGRGIYRRWIEQGGADLNVKEIAAYARNGDTRAAELMKETGKMLGQMLTEHLKGQAVERIVIGGQIAKALDLMMEGFCSTCSITVCRAEHIEDAALRGAYAYAEWGDQLLKIDQSVQVENGG